MTILSKNDNKKKNYDSFWFWVKLYITIYPYVFNTGYKFLNIIPFYTFVKPRLYDYLKNIEKGLIYYLETNKKVKKNQFGSHSWFS